MRVYRFPKDPEQRAAWTRAVARNSFMPTKHTVLCEKHFLPSDFRRTATYMNTQTGKVIEVPLERLRLKDSAVPSVFANCPKYTSRPITSTRDASEDKKNHLEEDERNKVMLEHPGDKCRSTTPPALTDKMVQTDVAPLLNTTVDVAVGPSDIVGRVSLSTQTLTLALDKGIQACPSNLQDPYFLAKFWRRPQGFSCEKCHKVFYTQDILDKHWYNEHILSHRTRHNCNYCPYSSVDRASVVKHERTHTGERPFVCQYCQKSFAVRGTLLKHCQVHTEERQHECSYCGKAFASRNNLKKHLLGHTGEKPYSCLQCVKKFRDPSYLRRHEREVHSARYPLYCPHCGKGASNRTQLSSHMRTQHASVQQEVSQKDSKGRLPHVGHVPMEERTTTKEVVQGAGVNHVDISVVAKRHVLLHQLEAGRGGQHKGEGTRSAQTLI